MNDDFFSNVNAKQYGELGEQVDSESEVLETFFDYEHREHEPLRSLDLQTPVQIKKACRSHADHFELRRSMSAGHLDIKKTKECKLEDIISLSMKKLQLLNQKHDTSQHKSEHVSKSKMGTLPSQKFVSMAEQIVHFQRDTPKRFHSKSVQNLSKIEFKKPATTNIISRTIPQSPALISKTRARKVDVISQEAKEELELQEIKKSQFKANTFSKDILAPKPPPKVEKKPSTQPEPFNLTEIQKKPLKLLPDPKPVFVARPAPTKILQKVVGVKEVSKAPLTDAKSPKFYTTKRRKMLSVADDPNDENKLVFTETDSGHGGIKGIKLSAAPTLHPTIVKPFSFETRTQQMLRKKEEKIKKYLDEEKKAREFHAKPLPTYIKKERAHTKSNGSLSSVDENTTHSSGNTKNSDKVFTFKAKPPIVLFREPFQPVKVNRPDIEIVKLNLQTDKRAADRKIFEEKMKEREEQIKINQKMSEEEKKQQEQEEIARFRKEAVIKANPIPNYKILEIKRSDKPLTSPQSPAIIKHRVPMNESFAD